MNTTMSARAGIGGTSVVPGGPSTDARSEGAAMRSVTLEELDRAVGENALLQVEVSRQMALRIVEMREELRTTKKEIAELKGQLEGVIQGVELAFEVARHEGNEPAANPSTEMRVATRLRPRLINVAKLMKMGTDVRLNVGCGPKPLPEYLNVDERELDGVDLIADVRWLPFRDGALSEIYAAHVVEHFTEGELRASVLPGWHRLLKAGGTLRVAVPDAEGMIQAYSRGDYTFENLKTVTYGGQDYPSNFHYTMFSRESLQALIREGGFTVSEYAAVARPNGLCLEMEIRAKKA
jgi:predicted SAM-dependent methyltransferase